MNGYYPGITSGMQRQNSLSPQTQSRNPTIDQKNEANKDVNEKNRARDSSNPEKKEWSGGVQELADAEKRKLELLKKIDSDVRAHEFAHITAGGRYIKSGAHLQ